jgi:hypothetical protein
MEDNRQQIEAIDPSSLQRKKNKKYLIAITIIIFIILATSFVFFNLSKKEVAGPAVSSQVQTVEEKKDVQTDNGSIQSNSEKNVQAEEIGKKEEIKGWVSVGQPGFTPNRASEISIRFNKKDNLAYVAFKDEKIPNKGKATVKKFDGTDWKLVGMPEFTPKDIDFLRMEINPADGQPYIMYNDDLGEGSHSYSEGWSSVMKFNGTKWEMVGTMPFDSAFASSMSINFNPLNNRPYISYVRNMKLKVKQFDGSEWVSVGNEISFRDSNAQNYIASNIIFDLTTNQPCVAYSDKADPGEIYIMKLESNGQWGKYITTSSTKGFINAIFIAMDPDSKQIYLAYNTILDNSFKLNIFKFNGTRLEPIGSNVYKTGAVSLTSRLEFNPVSKELYIAYDSKSNSGEASLMKFNDGNWNVVGKPHFNNGDASFVDIDFDSNGVPYVAYQDFGSGAKLSVMKYSE